MVSSSMLTCGYTSFMCAHVQKMCTSQRCMLCPVKKFIMSLGLIYAFTAEQPEVLQVLVLKRPNPL